MSPALVLAICAQLVAPPAAQRAIVRPKAVIQRPIITGSIECYPCASPPYAEAIMCLRRDGLLRGAAVTIDGIVLPETDPGYYRARLSLPSPLGHVFTVSATFDGKTYSGTGGTIEGFAWIAAPRSKTKIDLGATRRIDLTLAHSGAIVPTNLTVKVKGRMNVYILPQVSADHVSVPTSWIPKIDGTLEANYPQSFERITFEGLAATESYVSVTADIAPGQWELLFSNAGPARPLLPRRK